MRLTSIHRQAFVKGVLADVPQIDYQEQLQAIIFADLQDQLPPKILAVWNDPELRTMLHMSGTMVINYGYSQMVAAGLHWITVPNQYKPSEKCKAAVKKIYEAAVAQADARSTLQQKVAGVIGGCNTLKTALERLPEFAKYLPADTGPGKDENLPAVANLAADLITLGWPKGGKKGLVAA